MPRLVTVPAAEAPREDAAWSAGVAESLAAWPEDTLLMEIGFRAEALRLDPEPAVAWGWSPSFPAGCGGPFPGLQKLGGRLVSRLDRQIADLVSDADERDELDRGRLLAAAALSGSAAVAAIATALVAGFGLAPSIAPLAAAALCRREAPTTWRVLSGFGLAPTAPRLSAS